MISTLKWDRNSCWNKKPPDGQITACPPGTRFINSPVMMGCKCPRDKIDADCNRHSLFTSFFYDTNIPVSVPRGSDWVDATKRIVLDNAIKLGIAVQKKMKEWKKDSDSKRANDYDVRAMELFDDVVATTITEFNNMAAVNVNFNVSRPDYRNAKTPRSSLRDAWKKLLDIVQQTGGSLTPGPLAPVSAIVFRSYAAYGYG